MRRTRGPRRGSQRWSSPLRTGNIVPQRGRGASGTRRVRRTGGVTTLTQLWAGGRALGHEMALPGTPGAARMVRTVLVRGGTGAILLGNGGCIREAGERNSRWKRQPQLGKEGEKKGATKDKSTGKGKNSSTGSAAIAGAGHSQSWCLWKEQAPEAQKKREGLGKDGGIPRLRCTRTPGRKPHRQAHPNRYYFLTTASSRSHCARLSVGVEGNKTWTFSLG